MKIIAAGIAVLVLCSGAARAEELVAPTTVKCAAVYGALAQDQGAFGTTDSLMGERYFNYPKISFDDRLTRLAGKAEKGVSELKDSAAVDESAFYKTLVDAETDGDVEVTGVQDLIRLSDTCDAEYGFSPSLGG
jgi:hypothetical protein